MKYVYMISNILIFILIAPLFDGIIRKITAKVQSRRGPGLLQTYFDIAKLFIKDNVNPSGNNIFGFAPFLAVMSILAAISFLPFGFSNHSLSKYSDIITIIYLLTLGGVAVLLGALSSSNTFAHIGASREMITMIMVEPVLAMTFILKAINTGDYTLASTSFSIISSGGLASSLIMLVLYVLALQAFVARQPFDIAEAEIEILEGPFIEYSGPGYGLFKMYLLLKQAFYVYLLVALFSPIAATVSYGLNVLIQLGSMTAVIIFIALISSTNPRLRIDQAIKYYSILIVGALGAITLSIYGY